MRVLVVDAYRDDQPGKVLLTTALATLASAGHELQHLDLGASGFSPFMTEAERRSYETVGGNIIADDVKASVEQIRAADAIVFGYHTTARTVPALLKGWLERTMVPGVGFVLNADNKVRPGLTSVRRLGAVTTTPHDRKATLVAGDAGRRTLMRSFRANCGPRCQSTFVSIHVDEVATGGNRIERAFRRW